MRWNRSEDAAPIAPIRVQGPEFLGILSSVNSSLV